MDKCKHGFDYACLICGFTHIDGKKVWFDWAWQEQQKRIDELQARVDAALQEIKGAARWIDEDAIDDPEFIKGGALRALKRLEQALEGGESK